MSDRRWFLGHCDAARERLDHQSGSYLADHAERLYATWEVCRDLVEPGGTLLSIGAGSAFVESALAADGAEVTVVDFPEAIELNSSHYEASSLRTVAADVGEPLGPIVGEFDVVLAGEIVEHVPAAPSQLFRNWSECVKPRGRLVVSTPNLGSIASVLRLLFMRPLLAEPERTFGPVSFANEGIHRREYMPSEIETAFQNVGLRPESVAYTFNHRPRNGKEIAYVPAQLVPRFRPTMIAVAAK